MLSKIRKLAAHPGFRAAPITVGLRGLVWMASVAAKRSPVFTLSSGRERLSVPPDFRYTSVSAFLLRDWVEAELHALDQLVRPGDVFVDVGANIGLFTLKAARLCGPTGRVIAIEPGRQSLARLRANIALNGWTHVDVIGKALADKIDVAALHHIDLGDDPQAFSLLSNGRDMPAETVEVTTLDTLVGELGLARLDCLKMDVEGAEPLVVAGGREALMRFKPIVIFEINAPVSHNAGTDYGCFEALAAMGYQFWAIKNEGYVLVDRQPKQHGNLIATHPEGRYNPTIINS